MPSIAPSGPNAFTSGTLDRAAHRRDDADWLAAARADAASRYVLFQSGKPLLRRDPPHPAHAALATTAPTEAPWVFIGLHDDAPLFAVDLTDAEITPPENAHFANLLTLGVETAAPAEHGALLATAKALLHWRAQNRFCAVCGGANAPTRGGHVLQCQLCGTQHFPRSDPAVIMLVTRGDRVLLGQSLNFPADRNFFSTLAGFVEPGENLEDAVRREVFEEVGVRVGTVAYHSSQPWPFPASLMLGFYAEALSEEIVLEVAEMRDARWFSRADIRDREALGFELPPPISIGRQLIDDWLAAT